MKIKSEDLLFHWVRAMGVKVIFSRLQPRLLGIADAGSMTITLAQSIKDRPRQLRCILAEEVGHILFPPRPGHVRYHSTRFVELESTEQSNIKATVAQDERKALQWATSVLMPDVEFSRAQENGADTIGKLADWFDVEPWFVMVKISYLRRKDRENGQRIKWRDIIKRG